MVALDKQAGITCGIHLHHNVDPVPASALPAVRVNYWRVRPIDSLQCYGIHR